jgi:hypothetical protein
MTKRTRRNGGETSENSRGVCCRGAEKTGGKDSHGSMRSNGEGGSETRPYRFNSEVNCARLKAAATNAKQRQIQSRHQCVESAHILASWGAANCAPTLSNNHCDLSC